MLVLVEYLGSRRPPNTQTELVSDGEEQGRPRKLIVLGRSFYLY